MDKLNAERLRALDEAATAGPWDIWREKIADLAAAKLELCLQVDCTENPIDALIMFNADGKCPGLTGCGPSSDANAELLAYLRNAVPAILAMAEENARSEKHRNDLYDKVMAQVTEIGALKAEVARLREVVEPLATRDDSIGDDARRALGKEPL
ncbi:hypothetical protein [Sphingobium sp.]|uniref:hypothetical protein n=1 Tax=Sphingobium sp. TaxID=1912891 RepID=UPI002B65C49D|nr:hypothetical protein [Sphingobium sp.]HUD91216.1 hypothetical protein [Sphingobium sp.]